MLGAVRIKKSGRTTIMSMVSMATGTRTFICSCSFIPSNKLTLHENKLIFSPFASHFKHLPRTNNNQLLATTRVVQKLISCDHQGTRHCSLGKSAYLSGISSLASAQAALAVEGISSNGVYEVGEALEFSIQLFYLGALLTLLGVGTYFVVRQVIVRRELENAAKDLQERVRTGKASAVEYFELGAVMLRKKFYPLAAKYLEQAIKNWDDDTEALAQVHNALGFAYASDGKLEKGVAQFQKAVEILPDYVTAWNNMGDAYEKLKDLKSAVQAYDQTLKFDPNNKIAKASRVTLQRRIELFEGIPNK